MPCIDNCCSISERSESYIQIDEQHSERHNECSPLCNCLCCNTIVPFADKYSIQISLQSRNLEYSISNQITPFTLQPSSPPPKD